MGDRAGSSPVIRISLSKKSIVVKAIGFIVFCGRIYVKLLILAWRNKTERDILKKKFAVERVVEDLQNPTPLV